MKKLVLALLIASASTLMAADGAALYSKCKACHGAAGVPANKMFPALKGLSKETIISKIQNYAKGIGGPKKMMMKALSSKLKPAEIEALAEHIITFK